MLPTIHIWTDFGLRMKLEARQYICYYHQLYTFLDIPESKSEIVRYYL